MTTVPSYLRDEHIPLLYKLARANQHSKVLFDAMRDYSTPNPIRLKEIRRDGRIFAQVLSVEPPPPILALAFGDFINQLRSALDHAVLLLLEADRGAPLDAAQSKLTALPVQFTPDGFEDWCKGKAKKIPELIHGSPLATRLEHMQPFHDSQVDADASLPENDSVVALFATPVDGDGSPVPEHHPLASLADWSNEDKHRRLSVALARNALPGVIPDLAFDSAPPEHEWHAGQEIVAGQDLWSIPEGTVLVAEMYPYVAVQRPGTLIWSPLAFEIKRYQRYVAEFALPFLLTGDGSAAPLPSDLEIGKPLPRGEFLASGDGGYYFNSPAEAAAQLRALVEADQQINFMER